MQCASLRVAARLMARPADRARGAADKTL